MTACAIIPAIFLVFCVTTTVAISGKQSNEFSRLIGPLRFSQDGTFQISVMQDTHFGENAWESWGPAQDAKTLDVMNKVLDSSPPDLVVLNGDLLTGENLFLENSTNYVDVMVAPMVERNLPWASTYGNHDYQFNVSGQGILERERRYLNARTRQMVFEENAGVSNYYLPVYSNDCFDCDCAPELLLWFFDSRGGFKFQQRQPKGADVSHPNWVDPTVVDWFKRSHARITARFNKTIPSLGFVHIPTQASQALQLSGVHPNHQPGINFDSPLAQQAQGWCPEGTPEGTNCNYGGQDVPFMEAIASTPGMMALFSGHDHGNTWCYKWDKPVNGMTIDGNGINLCFGQHTGYGGYGGWIRGSRQILVTPEGLKNFEVDTWNLLEDGRVVGSVSLNTTYGFDLYPTVPDDRTSCNYSLLTTAKVKIVREDHVMTACGRCWYHPARFANDMETKRDSFQPVEKVNGGAPMVAVHIFTIFHLFYKRSEGIGGENLVPSDAVRNTQGHEVR